MLKVSNVNESYKCSDKGKLVKPGIRLIIMWVTRRFIASSRNLCNKRFVHHVCIVGSGPAGCYTAARLLKVYPNIRVDIIERNAAPFGLVRYGVSPDHQDVKNVINTFKQALQNNRVQLYANVRVGSEVRLSELLKTYSCVVLATGAPGEKSLNVPGEDGAGVYSAQTVVDWYNGAPTRRGYVKQSNAVNVLHELTDRKTATVCIVGNGNVALDIARMFLMKPDFLATTDITNRALEVLRQNTIRKVTIIGRRGVLEAAFTTAEIRDILRLSDFTTHFSLRDFEAITKEKLASLSRPLRRRTELLLEHARKRAALPSSGDDGTRTLEFLFNKAPTRIVRSPNGQLKAVQFKVNTEGDSTASQFIDIECDVLVKSLGYAIDVSDFADDRLPVDKQGGKIVNSAGRVENIAGLYCAGWLKTGPRGVIATTMTDAFETANSILADINNGTLKEADGNASEVTRRLLESRIDPKRIVDYAGWERIDECEKISGTKLGKVREKLLEEDDFLKAAAGSVDGSMKS